VIAFDRARLWWDRSRLSEPLTAIIHDEWKGSGCRAFRPVLDIRVGRQWSWRWYRVRVGRPFRRNSRALHDLIVASDADKQQLGREEVARLRSAEVIVDLWTEPHRSATRFDQDIPIELDRAWDPCRIQIVQTCVVKGHRDSKVGRALPSDGQYRCFVDNARRSPAYLANGWPPGHPSRPYYYRPSQLSDDLDDGILHYFDSPKDVELSTECYFEVALVEIGAHVWDADRVLKVVKFGWIAEGGVNAARRCPEPGAQPEYRDYRTAAGASDRFFEVVKLDYPRYRIHN
jgi:hypothetical protein